MENQLVNILKSFNSFQIEAIIREVDEFIEKQKEVGWLRKNF